LKTTSLYAQFGGNYGAASFLLEITNSTLTGSKRFTAVALLFSLPPLQQKNYFLFATIIIIIIYFALI